MYTPPILYATQDDINDRRKIRQEFRDKEREGLIKSIYTVDKRDKFEKSLKEGIKKKKKKQAEEKDKKGRKGKKKKNQTEDTGNYSSDSVSDHLDKNASFKEIQSVVDLAAVAGPAHVVRIMRANPTHYKVLSICCGALGDMAAFSRRDHLSQDKGLFTSRNMDQYHSQTDHVCISVAEADGIKAILDAMVKHRAKGGLVLRGLWALEHLLEVKVNWLKFQRTGGPQRLDIIRKCDYDDPIDNKIQVSLKKLKKQPVQGNHVRSQYCVLL
jgi:hypothetical protein